MQLRYDIFYHLSYHLEQPGYQGIDGCVWALRYRWFLRWCFVIGLYPFPQVREALYLKKCSGLLCGVTYLLKCLILFFLNSIFPCAMLGFTTKSDATKTDNCANTNTFISNWSFHLKKRYVTSTCKLCTSLKILLKFFR